MRLFVRMFWAMYICFGLLLVWAMTADAASWWRYIQVTWEYQPPIEPAVDSYVLYRDQNEVCRWQGADLRSGSCEVVIKAEKTPFGLAVMFEDGTYSPRSNVLEFTDAVNAPIIKTIGR